MTVIYSCTGDGIIVGRVSLLLLLLLLLLLVLPTIAVTNTAAGTTATTTTTTTTTTTGRTTATTTTTSSSTTARARNTCCFVAFSDSSTGSTYETKNKGCFVIPTKIVHNNNVNINYYYKNNWNYRISNPCQSKRTTITSLCMSTSTDNNNKSTTTTTTTNNIFTKVFSSLWGKGGNDNVKSTGPSVTPSAANIGIEQKKQLLLQAIQNTENGKIATIDEQRTVLQLVRQLELLSPPPTNILQSSTALQNLNGTWYLQYTSPSEIINANANNANNNKDDTDTEEINNNKWVPINPTEGISNIETIDSTKFQAKGTVSAAGIVVDTANKLTTQSINVGTNYVTNTVQVSSDITIIVGGTFRPSDTVPNRVVVAFEIAKIIYQNTITLLDLSFVFAIIAFIRNSRDNGWLETTYLDSSLRIGRGNKGTLFILTKQSNPF